MTEKATNSMAVRKTVSYRSRLFIVTTDLSSLLEPLNLFLGSLGGVKCRHHWPTVIAFACKEDRVLVRIKWGKGVAFAVKAVRHAGHRAVDGLLILVQRSSGRSFSCRRADTGA